MVHDDSRLSSSKAQSVHADVFKRIMAPRRVSKVPFVRESPWFTWSNEAKRVLRALGSVIQNVEPPKLIHLRRGRGYDYTYSASNTKLLESAVGSDVASLASKLLKLSPPSEILFFSGLLGERITGRTLHYFFAMARDTIVERLGSNWGALYAPLANVGDDAGEFPLHCDLYLPELLWNVFEDLPKDGSGSSVFLAANEMFKIVDEVKSVPKRVADKLRTCLTTRLERDHFQWFYDQLHGEQHAWTRELSCRLSQKQREISLAKGDGYLLHDRRWLHGRKSPRRGVSTKRVHRLVFDIEARSR